MQNRVGLHQGQLSFTALNDKKRGKFLPSFLTTMTVMQALINVPFRCKPAGFKKLLKVRQNYNMKILFLFISILFAAPFTCLATEQVSCAYPELGTNIMVNAEPCGAIGDDELLTISKDIIEKINWRKNGTECAYVYGTKNNDGWYNINRSGAGRISPFWPDNSCEPFHFGLAVGLIDGKVIFYNQDLEVVKRTSYDWASGFQRGYSKVCNGVLEKEYDSYGDHFKYKGGKCGYIDANYQVIVPLNYPFEKTPKPKKP